MTPVLCMMLTLLRCMVCSSVLLLIHGPIVMFVLGGVTGLVLANSETDLVMPGTVRLASVYCICVMQALGSWS